MGPYFNTEKAAIHVPSASSFHNNSLRKNLNKHLSIFPVELEVLNSHMVKSTIYSAMERIIDGFRNK